MTDMVMGTASMAMTDMTMSTTTKVMTDMTMSTATMLMTTATPSPTAASGGMGGMGGMGMGNGCKISMLWNWNTIDTCFISSSWHVTSKGMFAGSCIGVVLLVILLEALRRAGKEYDRFIVAQHTKSLVSAAPVASSASSDHSTSKKMPAATSESAACVPVAAASKFRPSVLQQAVRALLHMCQFAVAYFVMLLAMYYNGYFIICIFIGAYLGYFIFGYESFNIGQGGQDRLQENVTVCCG